MGKAQDAVKKALRERLTAYGWKEDRYGNFLHTALKRSHGATVERRMRIKLQATSVRLEVMGEGGDWIRFGGAYLINVIVRDDRILMGASVLWPEGFI